MLDLLSCVGAASSGEGSCVFGESVFVGGKVLPMVLGLGALVSGTDDVP
jgi:hypothetical protein